LLSDGQLGRITDWHMRNRAGAD